MTNAELERDVYLDEEQDLDLPVSRCAMSTVSPLLPRLTVKRCLNDQADAERRQG